MSGRTSPFHFRTTVRKEDLWYLALIWPAAMQVSQVNLFELGPTWFTWLPCVAAAPFPHSMSAGSTCLGLQCGNKKNCSVLNLHTKSFDDKYVSFIKIWKKMYTCIRYDYWSKERNKLSHFNLIFSKINILQNPGLSMQHAGILPLHLRSGKSRGQQLR